MTGKTHMIGGVAAGVTAQHFGFINIDGALDMGLFYGASVVGALLPDICHPNSKIGRKIPVLPFLINSTFGHRTLTHSLLFVLLLILGASFIDVSPVIEYGFIAGVISHLVLDALTDQGIQLFYPFNTRVRFPITMNTGSIFELGFAIVLIGGIAFIGI